MQNAHLWRPSKFVRDEITLVMLGVCVTALPLLHPPIVSEAKSFLGYVRNTR